MFLCKDTVLFLTTQFFLTCPLDSKFTENESHLISPEVGHNIQHIIGYQNKCFLNATAEREGLH